MASGLLEQETQSSENFCDQYVRGIVQSFYRDIIIDLDSDTDKIKDVNVEFKASLTSSAEENGLLEEIHKFIDEHYNASAERVSMGSVSSTNSADNVVKFDENTRASDASNTDDDSENSSILWLEFPMLFVELNLEDLLALCKKTTFGRLMFETEASVRNLMLLALTSESVSFGTLDLLLKLIDCKLLKCSRYLLQYVFMSGRVGIESIRVMDALIDAGVPKPVQKLTWTPIQCYVDYLNKNFEDQWELVIDSLLERGCNINDCDENGWTPVHACISHIPCFSLLQDSEDVKMYKKSRKDFSNFFAILRYMFDKGADLGMKDKEGNSLVHHAVLRYNVDLLEFLLSCGCPANVVNNIGYSPIQYMIREDDMNEESYCFKMIDRLIKAGCDINNKAFDGSTALHYAAEKCTAGACCKLIERGADRNATNNFLQIPLFYAIKNESEDVCSVFLDCGLSSNVSCRDLFKFTPLHYACLFGYATSVKKLIEAGGSLCADGPLKLQPLHLAIEGRDLTIISFLIDAGASVEVEDEELATPLHYAAFSGAVRTVEILLNHGCSAQKHDVSGFRPIDYALRMSHYQAACCIADDGVELRFGELTTFPRQEIIAIKDVEEYFTNMTKQLKAIGDCQKICKSLLNTRGLGRVDYMSGEEKHIRNTVESFMLAVTEEIVEIDQRFSGTLIKVGSSFEYSKLGYPDEFDFNMQLNRFSGIVDSVIDSDMPGFVFVKIKPEAHSEYSDFINWDGHLLADNLYKHFKRLLLMAINRILSRNIYPLYAEFDFIHTLQPLFFSYSCRPGYLDHSHLKAVGLTWRGQFYKYLSISMDVNPVINVSMFLGKTLRETPLLRGNVRNEICVLPKIYDDRDGRIITPIFDQVTDEISKYHALWRISFSQIDSSIFQSLPEDLISSYSLVKLMRAEPLMPSIQPQMETKSRPDDRVKSLESSDLKQGEDDFCRTAFDGNPTLAESQHYEVEELQMSPERQISNSDDDGGAYDHVMVPAKKCKRDEETNTESFSLTTDKSLTSNCNIDDDDCVSIDSLISTYHVKQVFLNVIHELYSKAESGAVGDSSWITMIPLRVYRELLQTIHNNKLTSFFFPGHNLYVTSSLIENVENREKEIELRRMLCENLIRMMEEIGFSDESH